MYTYTHICVSHYMTNVDKINTELVWKLQMKHNSIFYFASFYLLILYIDVNCNCIVYSIYSSWILQFIVKQRVCYCTVGLWNFLIIIWELSEDGNETWKKHLANSNNSDIRKSRTKSWGDVIFIISILTKLQIYKQRLKIHWWVTVSARIFIGTRVWSTLF